MNSPRSRTNHVARLAVLVLSSCWTAAALAQSQEGAPTPSQELRDLVEQALDQNVANLEIQDVPIEDALVQLGEKSGLRFALAADALDAMPYGASTRISIVLKDSPLRRGLNQVFDGLGLRMRVEGDEVFVDPAPVLMRLGRRLTIEEVSLLARIAADPWESIPRDDVPLQILIDPTFGPQHAFEQAIGQVHGVNATEQLEAATNALGWIWMPRGGAVVLLPRTEFVRQLLDRPVDLNYARRPLDEVLDDLGQKAGVVVSYAPGALQEVQAGLRPVDLVQRDTTVRQTLERICGNTGLRYEIAPDGIRVLGPERPQTRQPVGTASRLIRISIPIEAGGATMDVILREDELPPHVRRLYDQRLQEFFATLPRAGG